MTTRQSRSAATVAYYVAATGGAGMSLDTSWLFATDVLHLTGIVRAGLFAFIELMYLAAALGMRERARAGERAGIHRTVAWALTGYSAYAALAATGPVAGVARVAAVLGGLVALHVALGIELRRVGGRERSGALARVGREMRERVLSRLGLGDDGRDAAARTRSRAACRLARLAATSRPGHVSRWRVARMRRATLAAGLATDDGLRATMLHELQALQHVADLAALSTVSPWRVAPASPGQQRDVAPLVTSDDTYANGVLDAAVLASGEAREWLGMRKREAVTRADALLPERTARQLAVALEQVGVAVTPADVRTYRSRNRRDTTAAGMDGGA